MPELIKNEKVFFKYEKVLESVLFGRKLLMPMLIAVFAVQMVFFCAQYTSMFPFLGGGGAGG
jgi:hypothetical protein